MWVKRLVSQYCLCEWRHSETVSLCVGLWEYYWVQIIHYFVFRVFASKSVVYLKLPSLPLWFNYKFKNIQGKHIIKSVLRYSLVQKNQIWPDLMDAIIFFDIFVLFVKACSVNSCVRNISIFDTHLLFTYVHNLN